MNKVGILLSHHEEVTRLCVESFESLGCMAGNPNAEDLIRVTDVNGCVYWCDEIEFINQ